jgi:hypothetical protein
MGSLTLLPPAEIHVLLAVSIVGVSAAVVQVMLLLLITHTHLRVRRLQHETAKRLAGLHDDTALAAATAAAAAGYGYPPAPRPPRRDLGGAPPAA